MNKPAVFFLPLVLLCAAGSVFAFGEKEQGASKPRPVEVSGTVRMIGNSPMTSLVITGEDCEWNIPPEEESKLIKFQQQTVTIKAQEYYYDRTFANGASAGREYFLKKIVVVRVEG